MYVRFDHSQPVTNDIQTFYFMPPHTIRYSAGQFIELTLPHDDPDERGIKRWFTLSSSPTEELLSITTKFAPERGSSFKQALRLLTPDQEVHMSDPMGDFVLPKDKARRLVFVSAGMGITPMRSMIKWLQDNQEQRDIQLLYAAQKPDDLAFVDLFKTYGLSPKLLVSQPDVSWQGGVGRLTAEEILEFAANDGQKLYFISGPEPMIETLFKDLQDRGIKRSQLVTDYFPGYEVIA